MTDDDGVGCSERPEGFAGVSLLCSGCYLRTRQANWPRGAHAETERSIDEAVAYQRYDWDQEAGQLVFSNAGVSAVVADIQFVGSVSTRSGTWLWSWANESLIEPVRSQVRRVRAHGDEHRLLKLACAFWSATEEDGWEMTAVAAFLLKAKGAYRSPDDDHSFSFMVLTDVRWAQ